MKNNKLTLSIIALILVLILAGFIGYGYYQKNTYKLQRPVVSMEIEGYGTVKMELYPDMAPNTVKNFIKLVNEGYYDGTVFSRVEDDLVQGGAKTEEEATEAPYGIIGEFSSNGFKDNELEFKRGTVGMGLSADKYTMYYGSQIPELIEGQNNSAYAEFFIMTEDFDGFNGYYAPFAQVVEGMEILDEVSKVEVVAQTDEEIGTTINKTLNPPVITKMTVETFGIDYGEPKTNEPFNSQNIILEKLYGISYQ